ncbi:hypothetical protein EZ106_20870 [Escherichia coli]|nr:hypothetical protein [Escherichia coli]EFD1588826.1 hypothetical protein [Escherichia coli]OKV17429.1 hypothetical protein AWP51_10080 [Escherichia coli]
MTAKTEPENDGKTADNAFEINCDRVKVTAFTLPLHQPRPGYSRGTAFAAGRTGLNSPRSRNIVEDEHEKRSGHATSDNIRWHPQRPEGRGFLPQRDGTAVPSVNQSSAA